MTAVYRPRVQFTSRWCVLNCLKTFSTKFYLSNLTVHSLIEGQSRRTWTSETDSNQWDGLKPVRHLIIKLPSNIQYRPPKLKKKNLKNFQFLVKSLSLPPKKIFRKIYKVWLGSPSPPNFFFLNLRCLVRSTPHQKKIIFEKFLMLG